MLRIERIQNGARETTVRATGRLAGPWVAELERSLPERTPDIVVILDLTDVSFVDRDGIEFLRTVRQLQIADLRCSAFVTEQINAERSVRLRQDDVVSAVLGHRNATREGGRGTE